MARKNPVFFVPDNIVKLAKDFETKRADEERLRAKQKQEREAREKRLRSERLKTGLKYAEKIYAWTKSFQYSVVGQELMRQSHIPTAYENIFFFDGHLDGLAWVGFVIESKGLFLDSGGRWSHLGRKNINSAIELAKSVDTRILKEVCEWIESGKVWECIERRFDYLNKKDAD